MVVGLTSGVGDEMVEFLEGYPDPSFVKKLMVGRWSLDPANYSQSILSSKRFLHDRLGAHDGTKRETDLCL
jgi:hypothetical protein